MLNFKDWFLLFEKKNEKLEILNKFVYWSTLWTFIIYKQHNIDLLSNITIIDNNDGISAYLQEYLPLLNTTTKTHTVNISTLITKADIDNYIGIQPNINILFNSTIDIINTCYGTPPNILCNFNSAIKNIHTSIDTYDNKICNTSTFKQGIIHKYPLHY